VIAAIAAFELKRRLTSPSTWVYFALFFVLAFLLMIAAGGAFSSVNIGLGAGGKVMINSPYTLQQFIALLSYFGLLITGAVAGQAVYQDFHSNCHPFFFTAPITERQYLAGRLLGAFAVVLIVFCSIGLGCWAGSVMFFLEKSLVGPNHAMAYVQPYLVSVIPNLLFTGALFFGLAALTRKIAPVYLTSVLLLIGYLIASTLSAKLENKTLAALIDPFGMQATARLTEYWTIVEKNTQRVPLRGIFLANRLLWSAIGLGVLAFTARRFRFAHPNEGGRARNDDVRANAPAVALPSSEPAAAPGALQKLAGLTWLSFQETVKNVYFAVIVFAGVLFMVVAAATMGSIYGTNTWPVTYQVLDLVGGSFSLFMIIIITLYAGELVWRERDARVDQLFDALPIPTWLPLSAKLAALVLTQVLLLLVVLVAGILIQSFKGYFHYEIGLYLKELFGLQLVGYALICVLAMFVQVLVNQKYVGHFVMVVYYIVSAFMPRFGFEHHLYRYGSAPDYTYSDMNGYGHFLRPVFWFDLYWAAVAVLLAIVANLFWVRGLEGSLRQRLALARARFSPRLRLATGVAAVLVLGLGAFIFYNTNVLNKYRTEFARNRIVAEYEKRYKKLEHAPQPRITDVDWSADLHPAQQALRARGTYTLVNKTAQTIPAIYVDVDPDTTIHRLAVGAVTRPTESDARVGFHTFALPQPLAPGAATRLEFDLEIRPRGFPNGQASTNIVGNGTFFSNPELPHIGYVAQSELSDDDERRKQGLPPRARMADLDDVVARQNTYVASDADWINLTTTVSTSPDQLAVAPGALERQWQEQGRRYFRYRTPRAVLPLFAILSARYQVRRDHWKDVDIEIDYQAGHEYNLARMIAGIQRALDYCTASFGPYPHKLVRIVEFPRYQSFAQSLPDIIPYSESVGFIAKVDPTDEDDIDYPFYITAHEVAHQWWAHQVIGGNVQGSTMLSETMAQYSALMVMKRELGAEQMKRFLRYELDRYLMGRSLERKKELPLLRVENQPYIHYQKGSLVMYALQDYVGEETVNRALAEYLRSVSYQSPPYTTSRELVAQLRKVTPPGLQYLIEDLFETITLYDNRALTAVVRPRAGKFEVTLTVSAKKLRAGELGVEKQLPLDDLIDVGVYGSDGKLLLLEKRRLTQERTELTLTVAAPPAKAGIDPLNKLIDRRPNDNVIRVETTE
jgi:ABC-type transport system involved in multi-copper enzyme maturation permease subunit